MPFRLEVLEEIIETIMMTPCVRGAIPVSALLVGPSGTAKSKLLERYESPMIHRTDSFTSQGLFEIAAGDPHSEKKILVVPDFNPTLSRRPSTVQSTVANLLSLTADGTVRVDDGRQQKKVEHEPVALISAVTPEIYERQAKQWFALGLRRRIIPIFFSFCLETQRQLHALVREDKINGLRFPTKILRTIKPAVPSIPLVESMQLEANATLLAVNLGKLKFVAESTARWVIRQVMAISPHVTLVTLARAHALRDGRAVVSTPDVDFIIRFIGFTDPERPREL